MKKVVCGSFGTIYYADILKSGMMSSTNRVDITDDALKATTEHIMGMSEYAKNKGYSGYDYRTVDGRTICLSVYDKDKYIVVDKEKFSNIEKELKSIKAELLNIVNDQNKN